MRMAPHSKARREEAFREAHRMADAQWMVEREAAEMEREEMEAEEAAAAQRGAAGEDATRGDAEAGADARGAAEATEGTEDAREVEEDDDGDWDMAMSEGAAGGGTEHLRGWEDWEEEMATAMFGTDPELEGLSTGEG